MTTSGITAGSTTGSTLGTEAIQDKKLAAGAHEFEAMLLAEMMKPLKFGEAESSEEDEGGAAGTIRSMGTEAMAKAISAGGGLGIAREILSQVRAERDAHGGNAHATKV